MRLKRYSALIMAATLMLAGCAGNPESTESSFEETDESDTLEETTEEETIPAFTDYYAAVEPKTELLDEKYMAEALKFNKYSDINALADVMKKAERGEKITVVTIGGSITEGTISHGARDEELKDEILSDYYANIFGNWWKEAFPDTEVEFINAGIGATGSYLAVHRLKTDVLAYKPDLVLIEFSVNDAGVKNNRTHYENLVRAIRESEGNPAVMLLMMSQTNYSSAQGTHAEVGFYYNLPIICYSEMIRKFITNEVYTAEDLSGDTVHPSKLGHTLVGEALWKYLNDVYAHRFTVDEEEPFDSSIDFISENKYLDASILDNKTITPDEMGTFVNSNKFSYFPNDWTSDSGDGELKFTTEFKNLGIMYYSVVNGTGAKYDVYVDGELAGTVNSDFSGGWGNYAACEEVYSSKETKKHEIVFKKSADSKGDSFTILGLLVSK